MICRAGIPLAQMQCSVKARACQWSAVRRILAPCLADHLVARGSENTSDQEPWFDPAAVYSAFSKFLVLESDIDCLPGTSKNRLLSSGLHESLVDQSALDPPGKSDPNTWYHADSHAYASDVLHVLANGERNRQSSAWLVYVSRLEGNSRFKFNSAATIQRRGPSRPSCVEH